MFSLLGGLNISGGVKVKNEWQPLQNSRWSGQKRE
jgi:hypothetical protein